MVQLLLLDLELGHVLLPDLLDGVESVGEPGKKRGRRGQRRTRLRTRRSRNEPRSLEDLVELLLEGSRLAERPVGLFLMAEDDVVEDSLRDSEQPRNLRVDFAAFRRDGVPLGEDEGNPKESASFLDLQRTQMSS